MAHDNYLGMFILNAIGITKNIIFDEGNDIYSYRRKNIRTKREKVYDETLQQERNNAYEIRNGIEAKYAERNENKNEIDVELPF